MASSHGLRLGVRPALPFPRKDPEEALRPPHRFYCGVDLHARTLRLHLLDSQGETVLVKTMLASPIACLEAGASFRGGLAVAGELERFPDA